jgi:cell wall-associated NlpC family hydrolase
MLRVLGRQLAGFLSRERHVHGTSPPTNQQHLRRVLRPADVLLIEGTSLVATGIKYLTQSTWSHAAIFIGDSPDSGAGPRRSHMLVEADLLDGVHAVGLERFAEYHCRICRPVGLSPGDRKKVISYAVSRIGNSYDTRNVIDLARYLIPTPPVPGPWRRKLLAFGSGDPTRAICSGLVAQAFQSVRYPILPNVSTASDPITCPDCVREILSVRHHSLFVPRDFDVSPYFQIVKPNLTDEFQYRDLSWEDVAPDPRPATGGSSIA